MFIKFPSSSTTCICMRRKSSDRLQGCGEVEIGCRQDSKNICALPEIDFYGSNVMAMWHRKFKSAVRDLRYARQLWQLCCFTIDHCVQIEFNSLIMKILNGDLIINNVGLHENFYSLISCALQVSYTRKRSSFSYFSREIIMLRRLLKRCLNAEISTRIWCCSTGGWSVINFRRMPEILSHPPKRFKRALVYAR